MIMSIVLVYLLSLIIAETPEYEKIMTKVDNKDNGQLDPLEHETWAFKQSTGTSTEGFKYDVTLLDDNTIVAFEFKKINKSDNNEDIRIGHMAIVLTNSTEDAQDLCDRITTKIPWIAMDNEEDEEDEENEEQEENHIINIPNNEEEGGEKENIMYIIDSAMKSAMKKVDKYLEGDERIIKLRECIIDTPVLLFSPKTEKLTKMMKITAHSKMLSWYLKHGGNIVIVIDTELMPTLLRDNNALKHFNTYLKRYDLILEKGKCIIPNEDYEHC